MLMWLVAWPQGPSRPRNGHLCWRYSQNTLMWLVAWPQGPSRPRNEEEELAVALALSMEQSRGGAPDSLPASPVAPRTQATAEVASPRLSWLRLSRQARVAWQGLLM